MEFLVSVAVLSGVVLVVTGLERVPALRFRSAPLLRPYLTTDVAWYLVAAVASAVSVFAFRPLLSHLAFGPAGDLVGALPVWAQLVLAVIVFDLVSYAVHVALHRSEALWCVHKVHHSSLRLDGLAATRAHMFENLVRFAPAQAALVLIGLPPGPVASAVVVYAAFGVFNHSNLGVDLRSLEILFVMPRLHRRHHVPATSHHNFGTILSVWDRWFGRLTGVDTERDERFGVPGEVDSYPQRFRAALRQPVLQVRRLRRNDLAPR